MGWAGHEFSRAGGGAGLSEGAAEADAAGVPRAPGQQQIASSLMFAGIGVFQCDLPTQHLRWTRAIHDIFGICPSATVSRDDTVQMYDEESREALNRLRTRAIQRKSGFTLDAKIRRHDGEERWIQITAGVETEHGRAVRLVGTKQDITAQRLRWAALQRTAEHDSLTGLANRAVFQSRFLDSARSALAYRPLGALVLFDIDGFKRVNDQYGHAAGDACLVQFGQRLSKGFPDALLIARIGGDEFAVLVPSNRNLARLGARVAKVVESLKLPVLWNDTLFETGACHGIAMTGNAITYDAEELFLRADHALYAAKRARRQRA